MAGDSAADTKALFFGSAAIGLAPFVCFFFQIIFPKPQLLIVSITAAFFYLVAASSAAVCWYILDPVIGLGGAWAAIIPGVFFQFIFRSLFAHTYIKVETVIEASIAKSEEDRQDNDGNENEDENNSGDEIQAAKNRLALNDVACGLAAGVGFGGMHAILMFGSLLASETFDSGVLYQPSCPKVPSLTVSSLNTFCFFFLDVFWMLFTFFGMRRRILFPRGGGALTDINPLSRPFGSYYGNTRMGGNNALLTCLITHSVAAGFTTFNAFQFGCVFSMTLLPLMTLVVAYLYWSGISKIYLPLSHSNVRLSLPASFSYGSHAAEGVLGADNQDDDE
eukprot:CAMPEP_0116141816 /NCGR_PEP_ID=MMETSP0329-20121206/14577_1 /TAXON_ID=697910 /ORGANISM="Pseudo-nitzschia arenysensis, Strain B593" /LENGTH=334 /DNA_ID=CAMNT_0003637011 /DNA_START=103 /DNA_END=1107 /DNA_ORIENTATION=-